jgi:hypothetical protein
MLVAGGLWAPGGAVATGVWTPLAHSPPEPINTMLLLSDGTVMAAGASTENVWYRLTPDLHGSYANGTWSTLAAMHDTRLYFSSDVLTNGSVFVAGGEYGTGAATSEIYDPVANIWTQNPVPTALLNPANNSPTTGRAQGFVDSESKLMPNGNVLVGPISPGTSDGTLVYSPAANSWSLGPASLHWLAEAGWVKLPDNSFLTVDPDSTTSERYLPASNQWINDATVPVGLYASLSGYVGETGPALLLPNGKAFFLGGAVHTALYAPSGSTVPGVWTSGPDFPGGLVAADAPGAVLSNGKVLCAAAPAPYVSGSSLIFPSPTSFFEYDPVANSFTQVTGPTGPTYPSATFIMRMLDLPDGTVLFSASSSQLYDYQPDGSPLAAGKPSITGISTNANGSYHVTGTLLNGICEGAAYGDDAQMDSNFPLIRMTNSTGTVYFARTFNWSSTGVMTGSTPGSTDFVVPAGLAGGTYSLVAVANGISSDPVTFTYIPDALQITPPAGFPASGLNGGPFSVTSQTFTLTNYGASSLAWSVINTSLWLNVSPGGGTLTPGGPAAMATVSLNASASNLVVGTYTANLWFTNLNSHYAQSRSFTLTVQSPQPLIQNGGFETGNFNGWTQSGNTAYTSVNASYVHSGSYAAELGPSGSLGFLSQTVPTLSGQPYLLSLWLDSPDGKTNNEFLVAWNGQTAFDQVNLPALGWTNLQFIVLGAGPGTVLQIGFRDDPAYLALDDVSVVPLPATVIQSTVKANGMINFTWNALAGLAYQLQYKTNLIQATWVNLGSPVVASGVTATTSDPAPADPQRFYRLMLLP